MEEVLIYPLIPITLKLRHIDGKMSKTAKSTLIKELEKSIVSDNLEMVDVVITEVLFFLHLPSNLPENLDLLVDLHETFEFVSRSNIKKTVFLGLIKGLIMYLIRW